MSQTKYPRSSTRDNEGFPEKFLFAKYSARNPFSLPPPSGRSTFCATSAVHGAHICASQCESHIRLLSEFALDTLQRRDDMRWNAVVIRKQRVWIVGCRPPQPLSFWDWSEAATTVHRS